MYKYNTMDAEGGLSGNTEENEDPVIATGLDRKVPTPCVNYNYLNISVMLSRGNSYARGKVVAQKIDVYGNAVESTNNNPIIDTR